MERETKLHKLGRILRIAELIFVLSFAFYLASVGIVHLNNKKIEQTIDLQQIWIYNDDENNPFTIENPRYRKIIDMNGEYVKYVTVDHDTLSTTKSRFIRNSKLFPYYKGRYKMELNQTVK